MRNQSILMCLPDELNSSNHLQQMLSTITTMKIVAFTSQNKQLEEK